MWTIWSSKGFGFDQYIAEKTTKSLVQATFGHTVVDNRLCEYARNWCESTQLLPIEDGDGADDGEEVEDALEGLRQRRVERDEVERAVGFVGRHVIG